MRYRLAGHRTYRASEAVGVVQAVGNPDGRHKVDILTRRGQIVSVPTEDIEALKLLS